MKYKLICFDLDGVIFKDINFWIELHKKFNTLEQGKLLTEKYLKTDYPKLVEEVKKLWIGKSAKDYYDLINGLEYLPNTKELFKKIKKLGYITAIISASSIDAARRAQKDLGVDHVFGNELIMKDGKVSEDFIFSIREGSKEKVTIFENLCEDLNISTKEAIYVGDSDVDIEVSKIAGMSIAFNSKSNKLKEVATHIIDSDNLFEMEKYLNDN